MFARLPARGLFYFISRNIRASENPKAERKHDLHICVYASLRDYPVVFSSVSVRSSGSLTNFTGTRDETRDETDENWRQSSAIPGKEKRIIHGGGPARPETRGRKGINDIKAGKERERDIWLVQRKRDKDLASSIVLRATISYGVLYRVSGLRSTAGTSRGIVRSAIRYIKRV